MELLSSEECHLIALRTLQPQIEKENLVIINRQLDAGSNDLQGYMGEYYKLLLDVENTETKTKHHLQYFVKSLPYKNAPQRAECERKGVFLKESTIYSQILPNVQRYGSRKLFPQCYYSRDDVIVLEDLTLSYRHLKPMEGYTLEHYKLVLEHLAALHAASIAWEHADQFNIGDRYKAVNIELMLDTQNEWFTTGLKGIVFLAARHDKYQTESAQAFIKDKLYQLLIKTKEMVKPSKTIKNVLCHRDSWDRNILFGFPSQSAKVPNSCCIVDFQLTKYCSPTLDVLFVLYIVASSSDRLAIYEQCLEHYYDCLQSEFVRLQVPTNLITKENFLEDCQRTRLAALKFDYYLNVDRTEMYLRVIELQPNYEKKIMAPIEELVDYLMDHDNIRVYTPQ
ncbi:GH23429 [Drosophila grimshawi]|uniref:GH23429 n=1 Tax=Drosophila grimshawi TaxID=7222 RepID=B4K146_DROGR|nr:GH23429 [Drosophila grimshawi]